MPAFSKLLLGPDTYLDLTVSRLNFCSRLADTLQILLWLGREGGASIPMPLSRYARNVPSRSKGRRGRPGL